MNEEIDRALKNDRVIDITTKGRKTGKQHRTEIWLHHLGDEFFLTGTPGRKRDWYANLIANPEFIVHLKQSQQMDIPAKATPITQLALREEVLSRLLKKMGREQNLESWVEGSPLVQVHLDFSGEKT